MENKIKRISLKKIRINKKFKEKLKEMYAEDRLLLGSFHKISPKTNGTTAGIAGYITYTDLLKVLTLSNDDFSLYYIKFSGMCDGDVVVDEIIGYTCLFKEYMLGFFILPRFRKFNDFIFPKIYDKIDYPVVRASIYKHNTRASRFLEKQGFKLINVSQQEDNLIGLIYEKQTT